MPKKLMEDDLAPAATNTWFQDRTRPIWEKHLKSIGPFRRYLEIGVFEGSSILWAAGNLLVADGHAYGIDSWQPKRSWKGVEEEIEQAKQTAYDRAREFNDTHSQKIHLFQEDSAEWLLADLSDTRGENAFFDLQYLDGGHKGDEALTDMVLAWRLLLPGGVMVLDDAHLYRGRRLSNVPLTGEAIDAFLTVFAPHLTILYKTKHQVAFIKNPPVNMVVKCTKEVDTRSSVPSSGSASPSLN